MRPVEWKSNTEFSVGQVQFLCSLDDYTRKTTENRIIILKDRGSLERYAQMLQDHATKNILEFGILEGGSAVLFSLLLDLDKFVGIDIKEPPEGLAAFLARHPVGQRIKLHFGASQSDEDKVRKIISEEFNGNPIDIIIDDASHEYTHTKKTFEIAFPYLRKGGWYVIEDWGWPHWKGCKAFEGQPAMSKLIFELQMSCATNRTTIEYSVVFGAFAFFRKAAAAGEPANLKVDELYQKRDLFLTFRDFETELNAVQSTRWWRFGEKVRQTCRRLAHPRKNAAECAPLPPAAKM